jgi:F-type H+-transporting ATPase subunit b
LQDANFNGSQAFFTRETFKQIMDETLREIGELLLQSIPTVVFMVLLYGLYSVLVDMPLAHVLAERRSKTEGAIEKARADMAAAEARTAEYEERLREARLAMFKRQEARREQFTQDRAAVVAEARTKAQAQVSEARAGIERDKVTAQETLQSESGRLAIEIIRTVLRPANPEASVGSK